MKNNPFANIPFTENNHAVIMVERGISDMRRGMPLVLPNKQGKAVLVAAIEAIGEEELSWLEKVTEEGISLVLTEKRAHFLFPEENFSNHIQQKRKGWKLEELQQFGGIIPIKVELKSLAARFVQADAIAGSALDLVKLAELLPTIAMVELDCDAITYAQKNHLLLLTTEAISHYKETIAVEMQEVCHAPLRLEATENASITAFRATGSNREHYAIIIGSPDLANPLVRVHSSCYTGDLLGSLHCDCGDQLKTAIYAMAEQQGGIILYLMQEGRGIGLTNKLRTYTLQATGLDTVDANETLGFDDDERLFLPAAKMLESLHISHVRLLSNNPRKAKGLEECGITVTECVPHIMATNQHNETYLKTKANRLGHNLPN